MTEPTGGDERDGTSGAPRDVRRRQLRALRGLTLADFQHPSDQVATDALDNVASNLRVTPLMYGRLHRSLQWACKILDVPEPELYVTLDPIPNAFTYGHTKPFITITSGLIDVLSDEELFFVIGHEVGHIKAGHVLYGTMARNIAAVIALIGQATLGLGSLLGQGLVLALYEWYRKAELTADRAALLCVQDLEPARDTFMKLAGGSSRLAAELDRAEFLRQVAAYEDTDRSTLDKAYKVLLTVGRTHPFAMQRARELELWHAGGFADVMARRA
jgi:Zn-dependent protease with chaperone function